MRMPSSAARSISSSVRREASALISAVRVRLTTLAAICARSRARDGSWKWRKIADHTVSDRIRTSVMSRKVCHSSERGSQRLPRAGRGADGGGAAAGASGGAGFAVPAVIGHEDVAEAPHGLQITRLGGVFLHQLAQAADLYVDGAVEHAVLAAARQFHQLVARQWLARML